jgi:hypothetical protein
MKSLFRRDAETNTPGACVYPELSLDPREQWDRLANEVPIWQTAPLCILQTEPFVFAAQVHFPIKLIENSLRGLRQYRRNQNRDDADRLRKGIKDYI